ncbi:PilX N-terminal domain-containing pilus assembly protein [Aestuariirhabdus sp. Z084]|uniref:pilus assembly PilX family protein n=1 Tax=Aestuariirhabdus haliotis TaxID=2918751 RepID=UPI00201B3F75|nr:PilX N-terminal domain-containing pilus assembly protein [Aestuariirhabdus haliotis]MCL6416184.1 PilX N-terminal domain-containing pilus assembly protein [Aestuariirhabdus haliotis]MCL6420236.1 PilX N-terminal domain-containing pilus assembly protein [Aestuariirhabdus haliotis]
MQCTQGYTTSLVLKRQRGSVLIVSLLLLLAITILAVSGIQDSVLQEKMVRNQRLAAESFQAAEWGVRQGELFIWNINPDQPPQAYDNKQTGVTVWRLNADDIATKSSDNLTQTAGWWFDPAQGGVDSWWTTKAEDPTASYGSVFYTPRYVIEQQVCNDISGSGGLGSGQSKQWRCLYRITGNSMTVDADAYGPSAKVQSTFVKNYATN